MGGLAELGEAQSEAYVVLLVCPPGGAENGPATVTSPSTTHGKTRQRQWRRACDHFPFLCRIVFRSMAWTMEPGGLRNSFGYNAARMRADCREGDKPIRLVFLRDAGKSEKQYLIEKRSVPHDTAFAIHRPTTNRCAPSQDRTRSDSARGSAMDTNASPICGSAVRSAVAFAGGDAATVAATSPSSKAPRREINVL